MNRPTATPEPTTGSRRRLPLYVWILAGIGAIAGALLAEPGNVIGNTIPSTATFAFAGLVLGLIVWRIQVVMTRRTLGAD